MPIFGMKKDFRIKVCGGIGIRGGVKEFNGG